MTLPCTLSQKVLPPRSFHNIGSFSSDLFPQNLASGNFLQSKYTKLLFPLSVETVIATVSPNFNLRYIHICKLTLNVIFANIYSNALNSFLSTLFNRSPDSADRFSGSFSPFRSWEIEWALLSKIHSPQCAPNTLKIFTFRINITPQNVQVLE